MFFNYNNILFIRKVFFRKFKKNLGLSPAGVPPADLFPGRGAATTTQVCPYARQFLRFAKTLENEVCPCFTQLRSVPV